MRGLLCAPEVPGRRVQVAGHDVPAESTAGQVVHRAQPSSQVVRLLIRGRNRHPEAKILRRGSHGWDNGEGLVDRPLGARHHSRVWVARAFVDIVGPLRLRSEISDPLLFRILPWSTGLTSTSAMNMPWKLPLSSSFASSTQCWTLLKSQDLSRGCRHRPGDWCPLQDSTKALMMSFFLAEPPLLWLTPAADDDDDAIFQVIVNVVDFFFFYIPPGLCRS